MLENLWYFFQDSLINKKFLKSTAFILKYIFCNNICWKAWGQYLKKIIKKLVFIQQRFAKLIETVIVKIDIVRKHLYFE